MILCVNCNPCMDTTRVLDPEEHDEVMAEYASLAGGGLNCARILKSLGRESKLIGFMPEESRQAFSAECNRYGIGCAFVPAEGGVRTVTKHLRKGALKEQSETPGFAVTQEAENGLVNLYAEQAEECECVVLSGPLPEGASPDLYARLMEKTPSGVPVALNTCGEALLHAVRKKPALVSVGQVELAAFTGHALKHRRSMLSAIAKLCAEGADTVLLTLGRDGAMISGGGKQYRARQRNITALNPAGAGDAVLCCAVDRLLAGAELSEMLIHAVGGGSAKVLELAAKDFDVRLYRSLLGNIEVEKV